MCEPYAIDLGNGHIEILCHTTNKPISHSDVYGAWCDDECGRAECIPLMPLNPDGSLDTGATLKMIFQDIFKRVEEDNEDIWQALAAPIRPTRPDIGDGLGTENGQDVLKKSECRPRTEDS